MLKKIEIPLGVNPDTGLQEKINIKNVYIYYPINETPYVHVSFEKVMVDKKGFELKLNRPNHIESLSIKDFDEASDIITALEQIIITKVNETL